MRGKLATRIRRHVDKHYPFMSDEPLYVPRNCIGRDGLPKQIIKLSSTCKRAMVQHMKRQHKLGV
jgi:hypothetical protein